MVLKLLRYSRIFRYLLPVFAATSSLALAQTQVSSRIMQPIDDGARVTLTGNTHPLAQSRYDHGAVSDSFPVERMLLMLQRPTERETSLRQLLQDVHTQGSSSYHKWLTPAQFGELYGPDDSEIAAVTAWLQTHGFSVARITKGKTSIEFSGSAGATSRSISHGNSHLSD